MESPEYDRLPPKLPPKPRGGVHKHSSRGVSLEERLLRTDPQNPAKREKGSVGSDASCSDVDGPGSIIRRFSRHKDPPFMEEMLTGHRSSSLRGSGNSMRRAPHRRKMSIPDGKSSPLPHILALSSSDSIPPSTTFGQANFDLLHQLSMLPDMPRLSASGSDVVAVSDLEQVTKALKLMVCVSRNKECLSTMISYLCLPKFMDK